MWLSTIYVVFLLFLHESDSFDPSNQLSGIMSFDVPNEPRGYSYAEAIQGNHPFPLENFPRNPCVEVEFVGKEENIPDAAGGTHGSRPPISYRRRRLLMYNEDDNNLSASQNEASDGNEMVFHEEIKNFHSNKMNRNRKVRSLQDQEDNEEIFKNFKRFDSIIQQSYVPVYIHTQEGKARNKKGQNTSYENINIGHNSSTNNLDTNMRNSDDFYNIIHPVPKHRTIEFHEETSTVFCSFDTELCVNQEMTACYRMINGLFGNTCVDSSKKFLKDIVKSKGLNSMSLKESTKKCFYMLTN